MQGNQSGGHSACCVRQRRRLNTCLLGAAGGGLSRALAAPSADAAVPAPPSGWTTVFSDDFNGAANTGVSGNWIYDTGPGSSFGTGEIETMTNSTANVHQDGNGNLDLTAVGWGSNWT